METNEASRVSRPRLASEIYNRQSLEEQAVSLIESRQKPEHDSWQLEPRLNARTAIFEELTAKGHLSHVEFDEAPETANRRTLRRLLNGWSDNLQGWEMERRLHEITEELTIHRVWEDIQAGELPKDTVVITISDFPEMCPDYMAPRIGYRALNKKGMVRVTEFSGGKRVIEQISRSNSNDGSSESFLAANGIVAGSGSARILGSQIIAAKRDFPDGVISVQRALDSMAGPDIIYGENHGLAEKHLPDYHELRQVSADREDQAAGFINKLADFEAKLNRDYQTGKISYSEKLAKYNARRKELVTQICLLNPAYARDARGEAAVVHFEQASLAMASGDHQSGISHMEEALATSDPDAGVVCGGEPFEESNAQLGQKAAQTYNEALQERKNWKWKKGVCAVKECPTRPEKTEVGPCRVCRKCQTIFDKGKKPESVYKTAGFWESVIRALAA